MSNREDNVTAGPAASSAVTEKIQCLIAPRRGRIARLLGLSPLRATALTQLVNEVASEPGAEIVREIKPRRKSEGGDDEATSVYVARLELDSFLRWRARADTTRPELSIELDGELDYNWGSSNSPVSAQGALVERLKVDRLRRALSVSRASSNASFRVRVVGENDEPVASAHVQIDSVFGTREGTTDASGELTLTLPASASGAIRSLSVDPARGYWTRYLRSPSLSPEGENLIRLRALESAAAESRGERYGWSQRALGLDRLPPHVTGRGAKVAIIDSGIDAQHPLLRHIVSGIDLGNEGNRSSWGEDPIGHGSHGAGIIGARHDGEGTVLRGFAPQAEIHVLKVFPGGRYSTLIEAIDYAIEKQIDVVNLSLGGSDVSEAVEQKLEEAVQSGVAFVAAAGDSGGPVQFPASSPHVLSVAAVGLLGSFPPNSWESQTIPAQRELVSRDGTFVPVFGAWGPKVDVSAPGVGVVSTVPGAGLGAHSGSSVAAAHVSGLAALLVAHHPWLDKTREGRGPQRVAALYQLIRDACPPAGSTVYQQDLGPLRVGAGIPLVPGILAELESANRSARIGSFSHLTAAPSAVIANPFGAAPLTSPLLYRSF